MKKAKRTLNSKEQCELVASACGVGTGLCSAPFMVQKRKVGSGNLGLFFSFNGLQGMDSKPTESCCVQPSRLIAKATG